jgi:hypothetical protein
MKNQFETDKSYYTGGLSVISLHNLKKEMTWLKITPSTDCGTNG